MIMTDTLPPVLGKVLPVLLNYSVHVLDRYSDVLPVLGKLKNKEVTSIKSKFLYLHALC